MYKLLLFHLSTMMLFISSCRESEPPRLTEDSQTSVIASEENLTKAPVHASEDDDPLEVEVKDITISQSPDIVAKEIRLLCRGIASRETPELGISIGCRLNDSADQRLASGAIKIELASFRFEPSVLPPGLKSIKEIPRAPSDWDTIFDFSGLDPSLLARAATSGSYTYERINEAGISEKLRFSLTQANMGIEPLDICHGTRIDGVCYFQTSNSCMADCSARGGIPDIRFIDRLSNNQTLCRTAIANLTGRTGFQFTLINGDASFGCLSIFANGMTTFASGNLRINVNFQPLDSNYKTMCACVPPAR